MINDWLPTGVFLSTNRLTALKARIEGKQEPTFSAFVALQDVANSHLQRAPEVPYRWYVPPFYQDRQGHQNAKFSLANDANASYQLALMYRLTGESSYAAQAANFIDAWVNGLNELSTEDDSTLSFSYHFPAFIFAADLIRDFEQWPERNQHVFREFLQLKALPMNTMDRENNWGNWGMLLVMAIAAYLHDYHLFWQAINRWKQFIETQIAADGHLPHEVTRNGGQGDLGLWYSNFSLMPQTIAAEIAMVNSVDLYDYISPSGRTLRQAFDKLIPWVRNPETFPYYRGTDPTEQKGTNYISYWEILNSRWPNASAKAMLSAMRPLTAAHCTPCLTLTHGE